MKKRIAAILVSSACSIFAQDLKIIRPQIFQEGTIEREICLYQKTATKVNSDTSSSEKFTVAGKKKITRKKVRFIFFLYNSGKIIYKVQTKSLSHTFIPSDPKLTGTLKDDKKFTGALATLPKNTSLLILDTPNDFFVGDKAQGIPKFPLILSNSELGIVELRPGEGTVIASETELAPLSPGKYIIQYNPNNLNGRYDFWQGSVISETFLLK